MGDLVYILSAIRFSHSLGRYPFKKEIVPSDGVNSFLSSKIYRKKLLLLFLRVHCKYSFNTERSGVNKDSVPASTTKLN